MTAITLFASTFALVFFTLFLYITILSKPFKQLILPYSYV